MSAGEASAGEPWTNAVWASDFHVRPYGANDPALTQPIRLVSMSIDLPLSIGWAQIFADATLDAQRRLAADRRRYMSGPDRWERKLARVFRISPRLLGLTPPPLAINGHAYQQRQRNRVKRRRR